MKVIKLKLFSKLGVIILNKQILQTGAHLKSNVFLQNGLHFYFLVVGLV